MGIYEILITIGGAIVTILIYAFARIEHLSKKNSQKDEQLRQVRDQAAAERIKQDRIDTERRREREKTERLQEKLANLDVTLLSNEQLNILYEDPAEVLEGLDPGPMETTDPKKAR